jgi:hypothetical protein
MGRYQIHHVAAERSLVAAAVCTIVVLLPPFEEAAPALVASAPVPRLTNVADTASAKAIPAVRTRAPFDIFTVNSPCKNFLPAQHEHQVWQIFL